jgi:hypothetical protein
MYCMYSTVQYSTVPCYSSGDSEGDPDGPGCRNPLFYAELVEFKHCRGCMYCTDKHLSRIG